MRCKVLLLLLFEVCAVSAHTQVFKVLYDLDLYPDAVCNDGTPGAFRGPQRGGICRSQRSGAVRAYLAF
jgi:hypothetical protein